MSVNDVKASLEDVRQKTLANKDSAAYLVQALDMCVDDLSAIVQGSSSGEIAVSQLFDAVKEMSEVRDALEEAAAGMQDYIVKLSS